MYIVMLIREGRIFRHCLVARLAALPNGQLIIGVILYGKMREEWVIGSCYLYAEQIE